MPADNAIYPDLAEGWWDEEHFLSLLRSAFNARFDYYAEVLDRVGTTHREGARLLDLGCGGGLLLDQFAGLGLEVTGLDPVHEALTTARQAASGRGYETHLVGGVGEALPFADDSFDVVCCSDVLEHVASPHAVVAEVRRVLAPGGVFLFDTLNRTWQSYIGGILIAQEWQATAFMPRGLHGWDMFVRPSEMREAVTRFGMVPGGITGLGPAGTGPGLLGEYVGYLRMAWWLRQRATGRIGFTELATRMPYTTTRDLSIAYAGWAVRPASDATVRSIRPATSTASPSSAAPAE